MPLSSRPGYFFEQGYLPLASSVTTNPTPETLEHVNEAAVTYRYTSLYIVTQSQAETKAKKTTSVSHDPVEAGVKKMEQELLLYMNEGGQETLRMTCWDYGGQVEILNSTLYWCVYLLDIVHVRGH